MRAQTPSPVSPNAADDSNTKALTLDPFVVTGQLDKARDTLMPSLGASTFTIDSVQIELQPMGNNAPFSQVILRAPGVAQDSAANGDLHVRGEHANLQYRINDVLLPEGISGFGLELDPRFVGSLQLITGSLPAQYGFRTAGIVDIHTKNGSLDTGGETEVFGGTNGTLRTSAETGGTQGKLSYFIDGSYNQSGIGIENPTASTIPIHDTTDQFKTLAYLSYVLNDTSRFSLMGSASVSKFQVPNTPGLPAGTSPDGNQWLPGKFDSSSLNERQNEQNYFGVASYQKTAGELNFQVAGYARFSSAHFTPDPIGDLFFNGVASDVARKIYSGGLQADASYGHYDNHTVRFGGMLLAERLADNTNTSVFPVDQNGDPTGTAYPIADQGSQHALFFGIYGQDEWKLAPKLTVNFGARFDAYTSSFDRETQFSPRANFVYQLTDTTTFHAGYARYFTPPPLENVSSATLALFTGTSNASAVTVNDPVRAERSHYFDVGLTRNITPRLQVGVDAYYKTARNQLDDGLFGQSLILSSFNYTEGRVYGLELSSAYAKGGFSAYANAARSVAQGRSWNSAQFLFDPARLAYVQNHWIYLDHEQQFTASVGASYSWKRVHGGTRIYADLLYGSGLRTDGTDSNGDTIPNGGHVPAYHTANLGAEQSFKLSAKRTLKLRLDLVNLTDEVYELRNGSGVGVNAAQFGARRSIFGSVGLSF